MFDSKVLNAVKFVAYLNELAEMSKKGFFPFSRCNVENRDEWHGGIVYVDDPQDGKLAGLEVNDVAATVVTGAADHDVTNGYGSIFADLCGYNCKAAVQLPQEGEQDAPAVCISFEDDGNTTFVVEGGEWYIA